MRGFVGAGLIALAGFLAGCNNNPLPDGAAASNTL
jgi:hypothetical protein